MPFGYNGKILHVNLTDNTWEIEKPDETWYRTYIGGSSLVAYYLLKYLKPGIDPLSEDNILVFACSVVTGAPLSGFSRYSVAAKSPLTGAFARTEAADISGRNSSLRASMPSWCGAAPPNRSICTSTTVKSRSGTPVRSGERTTG